MRVISKREGREPIGDVRGILHLGTGRKPWSGYFMAQLKCRNRALPFLSLDSPLTPDFDCFLPKIYSVSKQRLRLSFFPELKLLLNLRASEVPLIEKPDARVQVLSGLAAPGAGTGMAAVLEPGMK